MNLSEIKGFTPLEKKVAAKTLYNMGWSSKKIEQWLGISDDSVIRASEQPTPEQLRQFELDFTTTIQNEKRRGVALVINKINELIPKANRVDHIPHVVKAGEFLEGKHTPQTIQQFNIGSELGVKFEKQDAYSKTT